MPDSQHDYDHLIRVEAWTARLELRLMQQRLHEAEKVARRAGRTDEAQLISQALAKTIKSATAATLLHRLDQVHNETGRWKPTPHQSLEERMAAAVRLLDDVGRLGHCWRELLLNYNAVGLPNNPLYKP